MFKNDAKTLAISSLYSSQNYHGKKLKTCQEQPYWVSVCNDFDVQRNNFTTM